MHAPHSAAVDRMCSRIRSRFTGGIPVAPGAGPAVVSAAAGNASVGNVAGDRLAGAAGRAGGAGGALIGRPAPARLLVECRRGRSSHHDRDRGGNRERGGNGDSGRGGYGDKRKSGPLGAGGDKADVAQHPYAIKITTPPARELGIHCLPQNTQCGETVEIEGESYVVLGVTYRYRLQKGKYTARERQLEVQSRGRFLVNMYLADMLDKS
ncbi:hypothetical protein CLOM_g24544 [Closterium sp. NIES-68]|nr:hypothetical protein CLOM_g24544 [Closterium sp. NIES-68]GJP70981.1 hypothetical protein CLOP_g1873 [Closterium sp. NIES-67]